MEEKKLFLQPRLQMLADLVPQNALLADVGTDHGYLPVWLLQEGKIQRAIASDIHEQPLAHARRTAREYGFSDQIEFRLCAGLDHYGPEDADTIIIAGMGGETIAEILAAAPWTRRAGIRMLLQPMTKTETLRIWLYNKGYTFTVERLVWDKNYLYPIFCVEGGPCRKISLEEAYAGLLLTKDPLWGKYLTQQMKKLRIRIDGLRSSEKDSAQVELQELEHLYKALSLRKERLHDDGT